MSNIRVARSIRLMTLLRSRVARRARDLADKLEISERTLYRDLDALKLAGFPCRFDKEKGGIEFMGDYFLPPTQLTLGEALALSVLASQLAGQRQFPLMQEAWQAVIKIRSQLPAALREEVGTADGTVRVQAARVSPQENCAAYFETFRKAIAGTRIVRCVYDSEKSGRQTFRFHPYSLFFSQRAWYVIGHSELRKSERSLKLNRLREVVATDVPFMPPDSWSLEKSLGNAWRMIRGNKRYKVVIRFDREFGRSMADTLWHPTQTLTWQNDGGCLFTCEVDGLDEIIWWVLGYGPHAEVIEPMDLRERVQTLATKMSDLYTSRKLEPREAALAKAVRRRTRDSEKLLHSV